MAKKAKPPCWTDDDPHWTIKLFQLGKNRFSVVYGLQVDNGLNYSQAAAKLGQAIMHKAACNGTLDNEING